MHTFDFHNLLSFHKKEVEIQSVNKIEKVVKIFRFQNLYHKFIFFLLREGIIKLFQKYISQKFYKTTQGKEVFLVVKLKKKELHFAGLQHSLNQPIYYFLESSQRTTLPSIDSYKNLMKYNPFWGYIPDDVPFDSAAKNNHFISIIMHNPKTNASQHELYVIGCGDYVRTNVITLFRDFNFKVAVDFNYEILISKYLNNFEIKTNDFNQIFNLEHNNKIKCGVIASYHSYHTEQAISFLTLPNSKVVIEKPPCVTKEDLFKLTAIYDQNRIFIGYNRRFIEWNSIVRELIARYSSPLVVNILIHETQITKDHWYFAPNQGTRICGNLCHWVDLSIYLLQRRPISIKIAKNDILGIDYSMFTILFEDGSIVNLSPSDLGDGTKGVQEYIYIKSEELDIRIEDYLKMRIWEKGKVKTYSHIRRDKGHKKMYEYFKKAIMKDIPSPYSERDLLYSTLTYISFVELFHSKADILHLDFSPFKKPSI